MSAPCPVCDLPAGFHDNEEPNGKHAAARAAIPAHLRRLGSTEIRRRLKAEEIANGTIAARRAMADAADRR